jgi:CubicO group peptidase (beta-lactamase class C family)
MWALDASSGDVHTDAELLALIGAQKTTNFEPGTEFSYSNSGYVLLSFIVKRATGQSLREFAQANLFGPLGMTSTFFRDDHRVLPDAKRMAQAYNKGSDGKYRRGFLPNFDKVGDGGLITTVEDLAKWDQSFYSRSLGGGELVRQQLERGILANGDTINYAAGLVVDAYKGLPFVEHEGGFMGYRNDLLRFPEQRFSTIILCNLGTIDAGDLARKVTDLYLENDFRQRLAQFVGDYRSPEVGAVLHVEQRGGDLWVRRKHPPDAILHGARREYGARVKDGENQFTMDSGQESWQVQFEKDASGRVVALLVGADRAKNIRFAKQ